MRKKILSVFLVLCLVVTLLPTGALADSAPTSGKCGDNLTWKLDGDGTLTISGKGEMYDYSLGYTPDDTSKLPSWYKNVSIIKTVIIKNGVTSVGNYTFTNCYSLQNVSIPDSIDSIGSYAFLNCNNLKTITIPSGATMIGDNAFRYCTSLEAIAIPDSVTFIGGGAFYSCRELKNIELPSNITSVKGETFFYCDSIESVNIPYGTTWIGGGAFTACSGMKSITIPNSVTGIGEWAFAGCDALKDVYYSGTEKQWEELKAEMGAENTPIENATIHYNIKMGPKAPELKITTSAGKPQIYWSAVNGAVKYWIYRSTDGANFKYYDSTTSTSYTNKSTSVGTTYYYKVKAVGIDGATSDFSVTKSILCKPAAPTVSINRSNGKPKLSWKAVTGATKYWIYRSTDGVNFKYWDSTTKTSYTNSGAASGKKYYYRVKAVAVVNGKNVVSANSSTKSLFTSLAKPSVSITTSNGKPKLTWKAVTGADKYYIYRSTDGKNFSYWDSTTKTTYVNSGAKKNTKYYYKVKAVCASNSNANSAQSATVSIKATK